MNKGMTAQEVLRKYQKQCDSEGIEVQVSRQALDETLDAFARLEDFAQRVCACDVGNTLMYQKIVEQKS